MGPFAGLLLAAIVTASAAGAALAQQEGVYVIPQFRFENGAEMRDLKVGYTTYGQLNADKSNAVLLVPGTSNGRRWADNHIGPGKMYDTDKHFFIGTDAVGGGTSSQPKDGLGTEFPRYTIRDMVRAEYEMVTKGLGLSGLLAVAGPSMGSFQGVEWGIHYPDFMKGLILIVPAARSDQHFWSIVDAVTAMITLDPAYKGGKYTENPTEGIKRAGMIYFPWLYSDEYLQMLKTEEEYQKALWGFGTGWSQTWDANSILWRYQASRGHDASAPFGGNMREALGRVRAKTMLLVSQTDRTIPGYLSRELYAGLKDASWVEIPSIQGHLGGSRPLPGSAESVFMADRIRPFLDSLGKSKP